MLGVLYEKQHTVPDTYPLPLNSLVAGCNQKTARNPVMEATESDVLVALDSLKAMSLLVEVSGSRVARYEHNLPRGLGVPGQSAALLSTLLLRGPQTAAELRLNAERLHRFADVSSVEAFLDELATKTPARVVKLARAPGARESRWAHLLCGEPALPVYEAHAEGGSGGMDISAGELGTLKADVGRLTDELSTLRAEFDALRRELGLLPAAGGSDAV